MRHKRNGYIINILIILLSVSVISCYNNTITVEGPILPKAVIVTPMWPQSGYNAQNTSSPYAPFAYCNTVNLGEIDWSYEFPPAYYSEGAEFCVDSKNNIYFFSQREQNHKIYKFEPGGTVIWIKDSLYSANYAGISLSPDEDKIYFNDDSGLYCVDSSGHYKWHSIYSVHYTKPAIGKDGTIYTKNSQDIAAISPEGSLKWTTPAGLNPYSITKIALDREENIYAADRKVVKVNKEGIIKWIYTPEEEPFYTQGVVIDGFNNIYFTNYFTDYQNPDLYSISKNGSLRWKILAGTFSPPVIGERNIIYTVGDSVKAYDTLGNNIWTKSLPAGVYAGESPTIDDNGNIYFITDSPIKAISYSKNGDLRWVVDVFNLPSLPKPSLMPTGRMLVAPKSASKIACIK